MSTGAVRPSSRRVLSTLNPSCLGSITSSTTRSHAEPSATRSSASAPSPATSTAWPSSSSPLRMKLATFRSSSTTRMRIRSVVHHPLPPVNAGHAILGAVVLDLGHLFQHFGYAAILVVVLLGNMGFPAPEHEYRFLRSRKAHVAKEDDHEDGRVAEVLEEMTEIEHDGAEDSMAGIDRGEGVMDN